MPSLKKLLAVAVVLAGSAVVADQASADYCISSRSYRAYGAPVRYPSYVPHRAYRYSPYRDYGHIHHHHHGSLYRSRYGGYYGGVPYYGRGNSIGVSRGGVSLHFGF